MSMPEADRTVLDKTLASLEEMTHRALVQPEWFHKALIKGAYQYLQHKDVEKMLFLLGRVPVIYYSDILKEHMDDDPEYAHQVYDIAMVLVNNNVVHLGLSDYEKNKIQYV